ncbi:MAG: class II glutamine amidotransferase [Deltaproteobacteria bacterium]|nr:MAG: class II glutamine amidotransferase [Deltaproteobacteria bacterium]TMQ17073.1 MAG: class II glutamine amidotransferase [Deltaproteobacteria bacterium]
MCELLAMSARAPTSLRTSLAELARHGGGTGPHRDGWGVAYMRDGDAFVVREPDAAHGSELLAFLQQRDSWSDLVIAHIRRATQGARLLRNTQPFERELGGRVHLFAHNGMLPGIEHAGLRARDNRPVGDTDSEYAFCVLLDRLRPLWRRGTPSLPERLREVIAFAAELRTLGPANFLYSDGEVIFAHGHRRRGDDGEIRPPGLHVLCRQCVERSDVAQHVALVASVPLTAEPWRALVEGEVIVLREGRVLQSSHAASLEARSQPVEHAG